MLVHNTALIEITEKVEIQQNFYVYHPDYPIPKTKVDLYPRFAKQPPELQVKHLKIKVQNYLHSIYFAHSLISNHEIATSVQQSTSVKNNTIDGIDIDFYRQLQDHNTSSGYIDPDWQVVAESTNDELIVVKDGLHLHVNRHQHLPRVDQIAIGDIFPIYLPPNLVGRDTYIAVGNSGTPDRAESIELYFNFSPEAALAIVQELTHELNQLSIQFQFAILHNPSLFHRYDAGTLWLSQAGYLEIQPILAKIYQAHQDEFSTDVPLFTKYLAPGLAIAEVPMNISFGLQRCELLATGLLAAIDQNQTSGAAKLKMIKQEFTQAGIDWLNPHLNPAGQDCYNAYLST
jgi:HopA1 effector protein family